MIAVHQTSYNARNARLNRNSSPFVEPTTQIRWSCHKPTTTSTANQTQTQTRATHKSKPRHTNTNTHMSRPAAKRHADGTLDDVAKQQRSNKQDQDTLRVIMSFLTLQEMAYASRVDMKWLGSALKPNHLAANGTFTGSAVQLRELVASPVARQHLRILRFRIDYRRFDPLRELYKLLEPKYPKQKEQADIHIVELDLSRSHLSSEFNDFLRLLESHSSITRLKLRRCGLNLYHLEVLCRYLSTNNRVTHLDLSGNMFDTASYPSNVFRGCITHLIQNESICELDLRGARITGDKSVEEIARLLADKKSIRTLYHGDMRAEEDDAITGGFEYGDSEYESEHDWTPNHDWDGPHGVVHDYEPGDEIIPGVVYQQQAPVRDHVSHHLTDKQVRMIADAMAHNGSTLVELHLNHADVSDNGAATLAAMLKTNTTLKHLDVSHNRIEFDGMEALCGALANNSTLEHINLSNNWFHSMEDIAEALKSNVGLTSLDVSHTAWSELDDVNWAEVLKVMRALSKNKTLRHLAINTDSAAHELVRPAGRATAIADMLKENKTLASFDVRGYGVERIEPLFTERDIRV